VYNNGDPSSAVGLSAKGDTRVKLCPLVTSASKSGLKLPKWLLTGVGKKTKMFDGRTFGNPEQ
jgi:hypothetical protein